MENRKCSACSSEKTFVDKKGYACWRFVDNSVFCLSCYYKMEYPRKFQSRRDYLRFKKQRVKTIVLERWKRYRPPRRKCYACGTTKSSLNKLGRGRWFPNRTQNSVYHLCFKCVQKYLYNPRVPRKYPSKQDAWRAISKRYTGKGHPRYGIPVSEETRRKISLALKGKKRPDAALRRLFQIIPKKDTQIEIKLQNALFNTGITFSKHKPIHGQPDIFIEPNICIFVDGNYWHANPKFYKADAIISKRHNWTAKQIQEKDAQVTTTLESMGYRVLRFWEENINNNVDECVAKIIPLAINK